MGKQRTPWNLSSAEKLLQPLRNKLPRVAEYCSDILSGRVLAGRGVRLAVDRFLWDLVEGRTRKEPIYFDQNAAAYIIEFFENFLCLAEGEHDGQPFILQPWQQFILANLFGWMGADGFRRFRTAYIEIGKGNGKSPLAGGVGMFGLVADDEPGAQVYSAATTKEQAAILFLDAVNMVDKSPHLRSRVEKHGGKKVNNLSLKGTNSFFRPVSSEKRGLDGKRVHIALIDELHEHASGIVVRKMRAGTKGRRQALIFEITNSGYDRHTVCYEHHEYSLKVLEGIIENDSWFAYVCMLDPCDKCRAEGKDQPNAKCDECDKWTDEKVWIKANPNLGVSIHLKYLREQVAEALGMPSQQNICMRLNFCAWTEQSVRWMPMDLWDACSGPAIDVNNLESVLEQMVPKHLAGKRCYGGLDLASTSDLAPLSLIFPDDGNAILCFCWIPKDNIRIRSERDRVPYDLWAQQGLLIPTAGNEIDYDIIHRDIKLLGEKYDIKEIGFDRWNAIQLAAQLTTDGFEMVPVSQKMDGMAGPTKNTLSKVRSRKILHFGNPLLRFAASNVATTQDPDGNERPDKEKSTEKIDPMVALIMANGRAMVHPEGGSVYDERGFIIL
ncbi:MAG TPA: terminase TerL endonuclease subunit [Candidatus Angelobacter sp.]|jgi:phage terminase large subunit-like protein|nr:terminase TerL endonuclease subunit [Candidatus Angelobacter sp.]